jgi:hypothetical protein
MQNVLSSGIRELGLLKKAKDQTLSTMYFQTKVWHSSNQLKKLSRITKKTSPQEGILSDTTINLI